MNDFKRYCFLLVFITLIFSCKKNDVEQPGPAGGALKEVYDSLSFVIGGESYVLNRTHGVGLGNRQVNLKPFNDRIPGRRAAGITAGKYYYGDIDSTIYVSSFDMASYTDCRCSAELLFTKKFSSRELRPYLLYLIPTDQYEVIKVGKQSFATDFGKENTKDGIVLDLNIKGELLSSTVPGFSIALQSHMKNIQQNSVFEITKIEKIEGNIYVLEAKFAMNVFNEEEKLYRVENGYLRKRFNMSSNMGKTSF
jgi:hypothetical protein